MITKTEIRFFRRISLGSALRIAAPCLALSLAPIDSGEAASLTARGNEPGWHIEVSDKAITFRAMDGETFTIEPVPQATTANAVETYAATVGGRPFTLALADEVCADTMTGMQHPKTATVVIGDRRLTGCGGEPAALLHGDWRIEEIGGKAIVAGSEPTLTFEPDGRIHGNGSCNRFIGGFSLSGEGLKFSQTGASMMACDQPLLKQEHNLLQAFDAIRRFEVGPGGELRLLGDNGGTLVSLRR
jgi:heat shock protein HslJ